MLTTAKVPECLFLRPNWPPAPSPATECVPPGTGGGQHALAFGRGRGANSDDDWRESLVLLLPKSIHILVLCRWFRFAQLAKGKKFRP
jgi:hypothetical protein